MKDAEIKANALYIIAEKLKEENEKLKSDNETQKNRVLELMKNNVQLMQESELNMELNLALSKHIPPLNIRIEKLQEENKMLNNVLKEVKEGMGWIEDGKAYNETMRGTKIRYGLSKIQVAIDSIIPQS